MKASQYLGQLRWCPRCGQVETEWPQRAVQLVLRLADRKCLIPVEEWLRGDVVACNSFFGERFEPLPTSPEEFLTNCRLHLQEIERDVERARANAESIPHRHRSGAAWEVLNESYFNLSNMRDTAAKRLADVERLLGREGENDAPSSRSPN